MTLFKICRGRMYYKLFCILFSLNNRFFFLQAYCSILYLKPRMQIVIRGQKVQTQLVSKSLAYIERDIYRPKFLGVSFIDMYIIAHLMW